MRPKIVPTPIKTINPMLAKNYQQKPTHDQNVHAQRVVINKQMSEPYGLKEMPLSSQRMQVQDRVSDTRLSVRKRAHNSKDFIGYNTSATAMQTPPPLKPRMRNQNESSIRMTAQQQQNVFTPIPIASNDNKEIG